MRKLFGGVLLAVGVLIAGASGLCSIAVLVSGLAEQGGPDSILSFLPAVAIFGGIPLLGGVGLAVLGRSLIRSDSPPPSDPPNP